MNPLYKNLLTIGFLAGLAVGGLAVWSVPFLTPRQSIYEKLRENQIYFHQGTWYHGDLEDAENIICFSDFQSFKKVYNEMDRGEYSDLEEVVHVFVDPAFHVLWLKTTVAYQPPTEILCLGFYFYTDPD